MSDFRNGYSIPQTADMSVDAGLRKFMLGVYNKLAIGLVLAGALAWVVGNVPAVQQLFYVQTATGFSMTLLGMGIQFLPLVLIFGSMFFMKNPTAAGTNLLYWAVVVSMGASLGWIFLRYTGESVASTFFITAAAFGGLSLFGYTTKKDLSGIGSFLIMAMIGPSMLYWIITYAGVLIFSGLIAYDTQRLKMTYYALGGDQNALGVATSYGALSLFIDFVNLFLFLLRIFGGNRN
jgi:FtsH-binding integral membrane protein